VVEKPIRPWCHGNLAEFSMPNLTITQIKFIKVADGGLQFAVQFAGPLAPNRKALIEFGTVFGAGVNRAATVDVTASLAGKTTWTGNLQSAALLGDVLWCLGRNQLMEKKVKARGVLWTSDRDMAVSATSQTFDAPVRSVSECSYRLAEQEFKLRYTGVGTGRSGTAWIERNVVHGSNFDFGIVVRNDGANPGSPSGLLSATVVNNLVYGQNGNSGAPGGVVITADGNNASIVAQVVNNTVANGRTGVNVSARTDLGANITGGLYNNIVADNTQSGVGVDLLPGFSNDNNLVFGGPDNWYTPGPNTRTTDPLFVNPAAGNFRVKRLSPAIDAGSQAALPASVTRDLAGLRRSNGVVDIGAYEWSRPPLVPILMLLE
jgi:hypothetical protein